MKKTTAFGAVLCSAALACSMAVPAFAAATAGVDTDATVSPTESGSAAETIVKTYVTDVSVSATVPLGIFVVVPNTGGDFSSVPTNYTITNTSQTANKAITLKSVKAEPLGSWTIKGMKDVGEDASKTELAMKFAGSIAGTDFELNEATAAAKTFGASSAGIDIPYQGSLTYTLSGKTTKGTAAGTILGTGSETSALQLAKVTYTLAAK